jgi:hypothetical protein
MLLYTIRFFYQCVVGEKPYTQQQPTGCAADCFLGSKLDLDCRLVVEQTASKSTQSQGCCSRVIFFFTPLIYRLNNC